MIGPLLSGLLAALSFPTVLPWAGRAIELPHLPLLAWVALVPLYRSVRGAGPALAARRGLAFGFVYYLISLYWVFTAMHVYGEVPVWGSLIGLFLLVLFLAAMVGGALALAAWLAGRGRGGSFGVFFLLTWIGQDFLRNDFPFGGFAWSNLAYSQASFLPLIQIADLTGVYGVTALVLLGNVAASELTVAGRPFRRSWRWPGAALAAIVASLSYGSWRMAAVEKAIQALPMRRVAVVQANIPQDEKWLTEMVDQIISRHLVMTEEAGEGVDFAVWPEAAFPAVVPPDLLKITSLEDLKVPLLTGAVTYEGTLPEFWPPLEGEEDDFRLFNSALVIEPAGWIGGEYRKTHLVPMGEYVPLEKIFFFLKKIVPGMSSFTPGEELNLLEVAGVRLGVTICYEDLFPEISRALLKNGADLLVNLTNDAWYGLSSALAHHFDFSRFRAVENRRTLIRATNTGVTGIFDATGRVVIKLPSFSEATLVSEVRLGGPGSVYTKVGDLFAWGCVGALALLAFMRRKEKPDA